MIDFNTSPKQYRHWELEIEGRVAFLKPSGNVGGLAAAGANAVVEFVEKGIKHGLSLLAGASVVSLGYCGKVFDRVSVRATELGAIGGHGHAIEELN